MIYFVLPGFVDGNYMSETPFKKAVLQALCSLSKEDNWVRIETEETEPGMPDLLRLSDTKTTLMVETKVSNVKGIIWFKNSQPLWYKQHSGSKIMIIAWDRVNKRTILFPKEQIIRNAKLNLKLPKPNARECHILDPLTIYNLDWDKIEEML